MPLPWKIKKLEGGGIGGGEGTHSSTFPLEFALAAKPLANATHRHLQIVEKLVQRQRDPEQRVRMEVVAAICDAASENVNNVSQQVPFFLSCNIYRIYVLNPSSICFIYSMRLSIYVLS